MSDHLIPDTICPSCSGTGKVVDLEKELFGDDELVFASSDGEEKEPVLPCSEALEEQNREVKRLLNELKMKDEECDNLWRRYMKLREIVKFLLSDTEELHSQVLQDYTY